MKRFSQLAFACGLVTALAIAGCAREANDERTAGATGTTGTAGTSADIDRSWVVHQLRDGDREVKLGRLAEERASNADVRAFGAMMVEKHTMAGTELKRVADRHNIVDPDAARKDDDGAFERLSKLSGAEFDREYLDLMIDEHKDAVDAIEDKADDKDEHADVKEWAGKALPEVKQHLERAKSLRERLDRERKD